MIPWESVWAGFAGVVAGALSSWYATRVRKEIAKEDFALKSYKVQLEAWRDYSATVSKENVELRQEITKLRDRLDAASRGEPWHDD